MLVNYAEHANPTSHKDVFQKIKAFAVAQGWNLQDEQISKEWLWDSGNSKYDFLTGVEDYIYLSSTGRHAAQDIHMRFRLQSTGIDPSEERVLMAAINPTDYTIDDQDSTHPVYQNYYGGTTISRLSLSPGTTTKLWVLGNSWFIFAVLQMATEFAPMWGFGTIDLYDPAEDEMIWGPSSNFYTGGVWNEWYDYATQQAWIGACPFNFEGTSGGSYPYFPWWWRGAGRGTQYIRHSTHWNWQESFSGNFNRMDRFMVYNNFTGKRTLTKPTIYALHTDGLWRAMGSYPFYMMYSNGLSFGQNLDFGGETYKCFPGVYSTNDYGIAFRIA